MLPDFHRFSVSNKKQANIQIFPVQSKNAAHQNNCTVSDTQERENTQIARINQILHSVHSIWSPNQN